jgi:hypothetical protein
MLVASYLTDVAASENLQKREAKLALNTEITAGVGSSSGRRCNSCNVIAEMAAVGSICSAVDCRDSAGSSGLCTEA